MHVQVPAGCQKAVSYILWILEDSLKLLLLLCRLSCTTSLLSGPVAGAVQMNFRDAIGQSRTVSSTQEFSFVMLEVESVSPDSGIEAGGTVLTLSGLSLLVGSSHHVTVGGQECAVVRCVWKCVDVCVYMLCVCVILCSHRYVCTVRKSVFSYLLCTMD